MCKFKSNLNPDLIYILKGLKEKNITRNINNKMYLFYHLLDVLGQFLQEIHPQLNDAFYEDILHKRDDE
jgi:hypothetical protein